jgi:hypothetical protein
MRAQCADVVAKQYVVVIALAGRLGAWSHCETIDGVIV